MNKAEIIKGNPDLLDLTPVKAIRAYCLDCMCGSSNEVKVCSCDGKRSALCPLYKYRLGHNPNIKREYSEEERMRMTERLRNNLRNGVGSPTALGFDDELDDDGETMPLNEDGSESSDVYGDDDL